MDSLKYRDKTIKDSENEMVIPIMYKFLQKVQKDSH